MDMSALIFPSILLGVLLIAVAIFMIIISKQKKNSSINEKQSKPTSSGAKSSNASGKNEKVQEVPREDVFKFMEFDKILNNMIVQEKGTKFTMAIKCKGINYDLMSDVEQIAVEEGFITFLNTLRFPIQLYVQAQNIDLKAAINTYKQNASGIKEEYEAVNKEYNNLLDQFDAKKEDLEKVEERRERVLNVYEYASDIINYVERLSLNKNLLQRNFYVLVSYYTSEVTSAETFSKEEMINICYNELLTRAQTIISALATCSVTGEVLNSNEIADLLYTAYNRDDKGLLNVREAIESGFYRLYSTSEDVFIKKQQKMQEQIEIESQYKALDAIKKAIEDGTYIPPEAEKLDIVDRISKGAAEVVKNENLPDDIKEKAREILVEEYRKEKRAIIENSEAKNIEKEKESNVEEKTKKVDKKETKSVKEKESKTVIENKSNNNEQSQILDDRFGIVSDNLEEVVNDKKNETNDSNNGDDLII